MGDFSDDEEVNLNLAPATVVEAPKRSAPTVLPLRAHAPPPKPTPPPPNDLAPKKSATFPDKHVNDLHSRLEPDDAKSAVLRPETHILKHDRRAGDPPRTGSAVAAAPAVSSQSNERAPNPHSGVAVNAVYPVAPASFRLADISQPLSRVQGPSGRVTMAVKPTEDWSASSTAALGVVGGVDDSDAGAELLVDPGDVEGGAEGDFASLGLDTRVVAKLLAPPGDSTKSALAAGTTTPVISAAASGIARGHFKDGFGLVRPTRVQRLVLPGLSRGARCW